MTENELEKCPNCSVAPGQPHLADCDIERCSICGAQAVSCNHKGDKGFQRWTGIYPGEMECLYLGFQTPAGMPDLNRLYATGLYRIFFIRPE